MRDSRRNWVWLGRLLVGCLLLTGLAGCNRGPKLPPLAEVSGVVTLDDKPLARGLVQFAPDTAQGAEGPPATGSIDAQGHYRLLTAGVPGAVLGWHKVCVECREDVDLNQVSWAPSLIPEKYNNPDQSGLVFEVKSGQQNVYEIKLSSQP